MHLNSSHIPWRLIKANLLEDNSAAIASYYQWLQSTELDLVSGGELQLATLFQFKYKSEPDFKADPRINGNAKRGLYQWTQLKNTVSKLREYFENESLAYRPIRLSKWLLDEAEFKGLLPYFIDLFVSVDEFKIVHTWLLKEGWYMERSTGFTCVYRHKNEASIRCFHRLGPIWDNDLQNEVLQLYKAKEMRDGMIIDVLGQIAVFGLRNDWVMLYQAISLLTRDMSLEARQQLNIRSEKFLVSSAMQEILNVVNAQLGLEITLPEVDNTREVGMYRSLTGYEQSKSSWSKFSFHLNRWRALNRVKDQRYLPWQYVNAVQQRNLEVKQLTDLIA